MKTLISFVTSAMTFLVAACVLAEKGPLSPVELRATATHIVVGRVQAVYVRKERTEEWDYKYFVAEIAPKVIEKGQGLSVKRPVYVRYWTRRWIGDPNDPPETTAGHWGLPSSNDTVRVYAARNAYDGFTSNNHDGGLNVIGGNGFEIIKKAKATKTRDVSGLGVSGTGRDASAP